MNRLSGVQKVIDPNSTIWCVWTVEKIHIFWNPLLSVSYEGSAGMWWSKFPKRMIRSKKTRLWTTYNLKNCLRSGHHSWCWGKEQLLHPESLSTIQYLWFKWEIPKNTGHSPEGYYQNEMILWKNIHQPDTIYIKNH